MIAFNLKIIRTPNLTKKAGVESEKVFQKSRILKII